MRQASKPAELLAKLNPDALLLEPREQFDQALVGVTSTPNDQWDRATGDTYVGIYDEDRCIGAIMEMLGCDEEDATEYFHFNTAGAYAGPGTPTFTSSHPEE